MVLSHVFVSKGVYVLTTYYIINAPITRGPLRGNPTDRCREISNFVRSIGQLQIRLIGGHDSEIPWLRELV